jgi:hypothetical protein
MSPSLPSSPNVVVANYDDEAPMPSQLDPASIQSPILDMDPLPVDLRNDPDAALVLHTVQRLTKGGDEKVIAKAAGISIRRAKRALNQLRIRGLINRRHA